MGWTMDFTDATPESVEREGRLESDWYVCLLADTYEDSKKGQQVFEFTVEKGLVTKRRYAGDKHFERLSNPDLVDDDKRGFHQKKGHCWASRLGLIKPDVFGRQGEIEWSEAMGKQFALKVERRSYKGKDGSDQVSADCGFNVFPLDHEKIPADVRTGLGLPGARSNDAAGERAADGPPASSPIYGDGGQTTNHGAVVSPAATAFDVSDL